MSDDVMAIVDPLEPSDTPESYLAAWRSVLNPNFVEFLSDKEDWLVVRVYVDGKVQITFNAEDGTETRIELDNGALKSMHISPP